MNSNFEIMDAIWFNTTPSFGPIGIVAIKDQGEVKFYIGTGAGIDEVLDREHIANWGAKLSPAGLIEFLGRNLDSK